jgi:hypothetical protein
MEETMSNFDDVRNKIERECEERYPGYKGPIWGQVTPRSEAIELPQRTQIAFEDGKVYWLDVPAGSIVSGDMVAVMERDDEPLRKIKKADRAKVTVAQTGMTLSGEYFETKNAIPHRLGTFVELIRKAA